MEKKELIIRDGADRIYGTLYTPKEEGIYPAVILSHGYNGIHRDFERECTYFAEHGFIAYAFDFCGGSVNSKSSGNSTDMTIFTEKANLLAVYRYIANMDLVDSGQIFLLGGSQGGLVTALAAEDASCHAKGMILYFPALNIPENWRRNYPTVEAIPETIDFWELTLGGGFFRAIHDFETFSNIGSFENPVLILYGADDPIVPLDSMLKAQQTYPNAKLLILPNEGHGFSPAGIKEVCAQALHFMKDAIS